MRRRRRIAPLRCLLIIIAAALCLARTAGAEIAAAAASPERRQPMAAALTTASSPSASSSLLSAPSSRPIPPYPFPSSTRSLRRSLKCDTSTVSITAKVQLKSTTNGTAGGANASSTTTSGKHSSKAGGLFRSLNTTATNVTAGGAISDMCSQAAPVVDVNATDPLDNKEVIHARVWTPDEIVNTALRRRGAPVAAGALTEFDLAAASPLILPSLIRYRPLSDAEFGNEAARVMAVFSDGEIPANSSVNGLPRSVARLEAVVVSSSSTSGSDVKVRRTISGRGIRNMLAQPELVLLAMASANRTLEPGLEAARGLRITKEEYRAFLTRDSQVNLCENLVLPSSVVVPVDRLFALADANEDGMLDASEIKARNLTDAATVWILAGDTDGDGMLNAEELANGLPQFGDLQPRGGTHKASPEQVRRITETAALAAVAAYDVENDGRLTLEEMRVYSGDFTRRSMGQTMVPVWAFSWHVALIAINDTRESVYHEREEAIAQLTEWKGPDGTKDAAKKGNEKKKKTPAELFPSLLTPKYTNTSASSTATTSLYANTSFDDSAALRAFMLSHANFSMSARAALAAAAAAGMSYASGSIADLAPGFDVWSRGTSPELTQKEWIDFYSAVHRTGAKAYWTIAKRAGLGAVAEECCGVLAPGLVQIANSIPPRMGMPAVVLPLARAEADAVRFDSDGDGIGDEGSHEHLTTDGTTEAALTHVDIMEWGVLRLGTLCDALPPVKAIGY